MANKPLSKEECDKLYKQFLDDPFLFGLVYCEQHFRKQPGKFHIQISDAACAERFLAVQAPRESAKSTILTFLHIFHGLCFKKYRFIVIVQNTFSKAASSLDTIKSEFRENPMIILDFPIGLERDSQGDAIFRHKDGFKTRVLCKGADQIGSIRGEKFDAYRPDLILIDDLEDDELVKNPERRQELKNAFDEALLPAGERGKVKVIAIGTILHDDCLMADLAVAANEKYPEFKKLFYRARNIDPQGNKFSLWPQQWSVADLDELEQKKPAVFAKEYQGDPSSGSLETIQRKDFRSWAMDGLEAVLYDTNNQPTARWQLRDCKAAIGCDLAWEDKQASDFSAIVPGLVTPANDLLIDTYIAKKGLRPNELENLIFELSTKYERLTGKRVQIGFEKAKLEKVMKWFLGEAQRRRNKFLWLTDINWGTRDKIERVLARLGNRYAQHSVFHKTGMGDLENQLIRLRSTAHDDIADAAAMLPEMLSFASTKKVPTPKSDKFEWLRTQTPIWKDRAQRNTPYVFGRQEKALPFKVTEALPW